MHAADPDRAPGASSLPTARVLAGAALVAGMLVATLLIVVLGGRMRGLTTPTSVDGLPLVHGPGVEALADQMRVHVEQGTQELLVGAYGHSQSPAFILVVRDSGGAGLDGFESAYIRGLSAGLSDPAALEHRTRDGIRYDCATVRTETTTPLSFCFFDDGRGLGAGLVPDSASIDRALRLTSLGREAAESG